MAGKYFEDLQPGMVFKHDITRTVTETDNLLFTALGCNMQPLHLDMEFCKNTIYGERIVNSMWTMNFILALQTHDIVSGTTLGNLGFEEVRFPRPVLIGDTLHGETEIVASRESKSRPEAGIVTFRHVGYNQRNEVIMTAVRNGMMLRRAEVV
ncbi:MaoC family dehydratase [Sphingobium sp. DEHP117]|uniref:MaoC family dehydratase n=1 Tax=Sphingobium sp. DEHP117 TaxID=2993436 RepID=UPI0027D6260B|nr:MaoC/PaaZ C-terminal domain-containing protein [Sphingobium sp. DEHP117]MDQ4421572.1 MaoC family dehydratase [Sphingobium sp. DEHP117]